MPIAKSPELFWLLMTLSFTGLMWTSYVVRLIIEHTLVAVWMDSTSSFVNRAQWALLAKKAHHNAVENLVIFAPLALTVHVLGAHTALTAQACMIYFFARVGHFFVYTFAIPVARTTFFLIAVACQITLAARLFGLI